VGPTPSTEDLDSGACVVYQLSDQISSLRHGRLLAAGENTFEAEFDQLIEQKGSGSNSCNLLAPIPQTITRRAGSSSIRQAPAEFDDRPVQFGRRRPNLVNQVKLSHFMRLVMSAPTC